MSGSGSRRPSLLPPEIASIDAAWDDELGNSVPDEGDRATAVDPLDVANAALLTPGVALDPWAGEFGSVEGLPLTPLPSTVEQPGHELDAPEFDDFDASTGGDPLGEDSYDDLSPLSDSAPNFDSDLPNLSGEPASDVAPLRGEVPDRLSGPGLRVPGAPPVARFDPPAPARRPAPALDLDLPDDEYGSALGLADLGVSDPPRPTPRESIPSLEAELAPRATEPRSPAMEMRDRYAMGDFSGALTMAEMILEDDPEDDEAVRYAKSCRDVLTQMYSARLGPLDQQLVMAIPSDQVRWLSLDHRAGFLLSLVDGTTSIEEVLDLCGMPRLDGLRILLSLVEQRVVSLR